MEWSRVWKPAAKGDAAGSPVRIVFDGKAAGTARSAGGDYTVPSFSAFLRLAREADFPADGSAELLFCAAAEGDGAEAEQGFRYYAFTRFLAASRERLSAGMADFHALLADKREPHVRENVSEFIRMNGGGKYIRGALSNLGFFLFSDVPIEFSDALALAYEQIQTSLLIHDDIIDHASLRRGVETIPVSYARRWAGGREGIGGGDLRDTANALALCAGDLGIYYATLTIVRRYGGEACLGELLDAFLSSIVRTMEGEIIDVALPFEEKYGLSENRELYDSVIEIYRLKTAWYTVIGPITCGAVLAGCGEAELAALRAFGEAAGIAFQIKDDIFGVFSDETELGKDAGSDVAEFKQTLLYAHVRSSGAYFERLSRYYGRKLSREELEEVREIFRASGALRYAEEEMDRYFRQAEDALDRIGFLPAEKKDLLYGLLIYLKHRTK